MTGVFDPIKPTKIFGGKEFKLAGHNRLKSEVQTYVEVYKKLGYFVRIVKANGVYSRSGTMWCLYIRKK